MTKDDAEGRCLDGWLASGIVLGHAHSRLRHHSSLLDSTKSLANAKSCVMPNQAGARIGLPNQTFVNTTL